MSKREKTPEPMTSRQRERMDQMGIEYNGDETIEEAATLLRARICEPLYPRPLRIPETAMAVESEGDPLPGRTALL